jgi:hypothetical protein
MVLVETALERGSPVSRSPKCHTMGWIRDIGLMGVISGDESWNIDEQRSRDRLSREFMNHYFPLKMYKKSDAIITSLLCYILLSHGVMACS